MYKRDTDPNLYSRFRIYVKGLDAHFYMQRLYELDSYVSLAGISHTYIFSNPIYGG
jgi:hypothetical protein